MEKWMYWRQPTPVPPQIPSTGMELESGASATGPWVKVPYTATLRSDDYWCNFNGITPPGDCFLVKFEMGSATHARARSTATVDNAPVYSEYSKVIALPEPSVETSLYLLLFVLMMLVLWFGRK